MTTSRGGGVFIVVLLMYNPVELKNTSVPLTINGKGASSSDRGRRGGGGFFTTFFGGGGLFFKGGGGGRFF